MYKPTDNEVREAARILDAEGFSHGWWPRGTNTYDEMGSIEKSEFEAVVERILIAARAAEPMPNEEDLVFRLLKRAEIRRQIPTRKSVQEGQRDRMADLLEEAAAEIRRLRGE